MYTECSTIIQTSNKKNDNKNGVKINIRRGVKQGDPLSPLLFNLCMEPLLETLEETSEGITLKENNKLPTLAFADDFVTLGKDRKEAQSQFDTVTLYLQNLGMSISADKCKAFQIVKKKDTWYIKDPEIKTNDIELIPYADPETIFKYLGAKLGPWKGMDCGIIVPEIVNLIKRVRKLPLKPHQKIDLLVSFIFPRFIYCLLTNPPNDSVLKLLDSEIRQNVKQILHLVPSTATGFFYAPKNNGGLGLPHFEHIIKIGVLKNALAIKKSLDPAMSSIIDDKIDKKLKHIANSLRINWPATIEDIIKTKKRIKNDHLKQWLSLKSQGQGVNEFARDKIGNAWLKETHLLKASRYIDAIRLRTNTFGTRVVLARADKKINVSCRRCNAQPETLGHVLGLCQHTKGLRIKRHDEVKLLIAEKLQHSNEVYIEPSIKVNGNLYKPDLIIKNEERLHIVDVTIRYENRDYLQKAEAEKISKYKECLEFLLNKYKMKKGSILPIVIGSRGAIPLNTRSNLKKLGLNESNIKIISLKVLQSSIEIANIFLDG